MERDVATSTRLKLALAIVAVCLILVSRSARGQSTDGYHGVQIFPVVVDSSTFAQRFTFRIPTVSVATADPVTVAATFYPGNGAPQNAPVPCPNFVIPSSGQKVFTSLRELCPGLALGSTFGYLHTAEIDPQTHPYAAYSRVSNMAGSGFSIEAFPAHTFTMAWSVVTGLRRLAATPSSPAYQTNCFLANLNRINDPTSSTNTTFHYFIYNSGNVLIGEGVINLVPGKIFRMLDIFGAGGVPAGDLDDARIRFNWAAENPSAPYMAFCTVQDNTSFGADFRIAKQEWDHTTSPSDVAAHDDHVRRVTRASGDAYRTEGQAISRAFSIPAGAFHNDHAFMLRHPDNAQCELLDVTTHLRLMPAHGLEMRMVRRNFVAPSGFEVIAGGAGSTGFGEVYLGDKPDYNGGRNSRYWLQVESNGQNTAAVRPYMLQCQSGSGHPFPDIVYYNEPGERF
ncbi:MAG: hypothetical protein A3E01_00455 [Gammaproteobacteria bacterium RIFCSPHIGHO2_12_FULL_63_22]|nr:MAG: hypothetical protein A3E01_00455 [Gammaproteobacteria bacterium RIFCSPHIGHO2_12_FULL_63_22]